MNKINKKDYYFKLGATEEGLQNVKTIIKKFEVSSEEFETIKKYCIEYSCLYSTFEEEIYSIDYRIKLIDWEDTHIEYTIRLLRNEENKRKVITDRANELLLEIYKNHYGSIGEYITKFESLDKRYIEPYVLDKFNELLMYKADIKKIENKMRKLLR